jgi:hypothetical protein
MADAGAIDSARQEEFVEKVIGQISGTMTTLLGALGDRLGLFNNLAEPRPSGIGRVRFAHKTKRAISSRVAGRYGDSWLSEIRRIDNAF